MSTPAIIDNIINTEAEELSSDLFIKILIAIIIAWILIKLWSRVIEDFAYGVMKLNRTSVFDSLILATVISLLLILFIALIPESDSIRRQLTGISLPPTNGARLVSRSMTS